jgi:DNA-directed RNA polymerase subunit RPC12/RpoP
MSKPFYIDYPQENFEGQATRYRCAFCKEETTKINGNLAGHLPACEYRLKLEQQQAALDAGLLDPEDVG